MHRFSLRTLLAGALCGHRSLQRQWRSPEPKSQYAAVIVGGGGHGLGTAYYLATLNVPAMAVVHVVIFAYLIRGSARSSLVTSGSC